MHSMCKISENSSGFQGCFLFCTSHSLLSAVCSTHNTHCFCFALFLSLLSAKKVQEFSSWIFFWVGNFLNHFFWPVTLQKYSLQLSFNNDPAPNNSLDITVVQYIRLIKRNLIPWETLIMCNSSNKRASITYFTFIFWEM